MLTDTFVTEQKVFTIQADRKILKKRFPYLMLKFCYDVFSGCEVDDSRVEARFDAEDQEEAKRVFKTLEMVPEVNPVKNWV